MRLALFRAVALPAVALLLSGGSAAAAQPAGPAASANGAVAPRATTVAELSALAPPAGSDGDAAAAAGAVRLDALLVSTRLADDGGIQLLIADPEDSTRSMTAELVDPAAAQDAAEAEQLPQMQATWDAFLAAFGSPQAGDDLPLWRYASLTGLPSFLPSKVAAGAGVALEPVLDFQTIALSLPLRAHEILENALQFELTGDTDEGSDSNLATVRANVDGTRAVLRALQPLLEPRQPQLWQSAGDGLEALAAELDGYQQADGSWLPLDQLSRPQRQHLDGTVGALLEQLAVVPDALELPPQPAVKQWAL